MPQVTIDGQNLDFAAGESIIQILDRNNIEIPYYCWHPRLSVAANCRICLVEVEKAPKLLPACQTECRDGMVVHTDNDKVRDARRAVQEFMLLNHPIDCPICDQAGECLLQDHYMKYAQHTSRMEERKVHKPRLVELGPHVVYNAERCILCTRCIRFMEEVPKERQIGVFNRGNHAEIGVQPGQVLDSPYSMNTVDVCPVGALTAKPFRFKERVWNLSRGASLCSGCARGCNTHVDYRNDVVHRLLPRDNDAVNEAWMCDDGRLTFDRFNNDRLQSALLRDADAASAVGVETTQAVSEAIARLAEAKGDTGATPAVALSLHATCEDAYLLGRLAKDALGLRSVSWFGYPDGEADDLLRMADKNPNRTGIRMVLEGLGLTLTDASTLQTDIAGGKVSGLLLLGHESEDIEDLANAAKGLPQVVHMASTRTALAEAAHVTLPGLAPIQVDGFWVNGQGRAQLLTPAMPPTGQARPHSRWLLEIAKGLGLVLNLPSAATIRAEISERIEAFAMCPLTDLGPEGKPVAAKEGVPA